MRTTLFSNQRKVLLFIMTLSLSSLLIAQSPESAGVLTFNDDQVLFLANSYGGRIYAYSLNESVREEPVSYNVRELDNEIADAIGSRVGQFSITDLAVNPVSKNSH